MILFGMYACTSFSQIFMYLLYRFYLWLSQGSYIMTKMCLHILSSVIKIQKHSKRYTL